MSYNKTKNKQRVTVWVDKKLKDDAELILEGLGFTPTSLINILYRQIIMTKEIPFKIRWLDDFISIDGILHVKPKI